MTRRRRAAAAAPDRDRGDGRADNPFDIMGNLGGIWKTPPT